MIALVEVCQVETTHRYRVDQMKESPPSHCGIRRGTKQSFPYQIPLEMVTLSSPKVDI